MSYNERGKHRSDYAIANRIAKVLGVPTPFFSADDDALSAGILNFEKVDGGGLTDPEDARFQTTKL